jgi:hypothetical protein
MEMRILICGDRDWKDYERMGDVLAQVLEPGDMVVEGGANGADVMARDIARRMDIAVWEFPANWEYYGKGAGPIRNSKMLTEGQPQIVLAFHNDLATSTGTKDMVRKARSEGIRVINVTSNYVGFGFSPGPLGPHRLYQDTLKRQGGNPVMEPHQSWLL